MVHSKGMDSLHCKPWRIAETAQMQTAFGLEYDDDDDHDDDHDDDDDVDDDDGDDDDDGWWWWWMMMMMMMMMMMICYDDMLWSSWSLSYFLFWALLFRVLQHSSLTTAPTLTTQSAKQLNHGVKRRPAKHWLQGLWQCPGKSATNCEVYQTNSWMQQVTLKKNMIMHCRYDI